MNEAQKYALNNPCYSQADTKKEIYLNNEVIGDLKVTVAVKVLCFLGTELWCTTIFDGRGKRLKKSELSKDARAAIDAWGQESLSEVGLDEIINAMDESDFDYVRLLTDAEKEQLPPVDLRALLKAEERQSFALANPHPDISAMIMKKHTFELDFGGVIFSIVFTVGNSPGMANPFTPSADNLAWHASVSVLNEHRRPQRFFGQLTEGQGEMAMEILETLLEDVGAGQIAVVAPEKNAVVLHMFRQLSRDEGTAVADTAFKKRAA